MRRHDLVIEARGLRKRFGPTTALDGFDLEVPTGAIVGVLGPNGAGKTTAVRILTTLTIPDAGAARVAGHDVVGEASAVRAGSASPRRTRPSTGCSPGARTSS